MTRQLRQLLALIGMMAALVAPLGIAQAQAGAVWVRGYPEQLTPGCIWYVAQWSDNTFTASPWQCEPGVSVVERDGPTVLRQTTGGYPQTAGNGCVENVTLWSDNTHTWVPSTCPPGVTYLRSQQGGLDAPLSRIGSAGQPIAPPPVQPAPPPQPVEPGLQYRGVGVSFGPNCGLTQLKLSVTNAAGAPVNGIRAIVDWEGRTDNPITTNPSGHIGYDAGWTDAILRSPGMVTNNYRVWLIDNDGNRISDVVGFGTNEDCTSPNARQIATVSFRAG